MEKEKGRNFEIREQTKGETHKGDFLPHHRKLLTQNKPFFVAKCLIKGENPSLASRACFPPRAA